MEDDFIGQTPPDDERKTRLSTAFPEVGAKATYVYDFGDDWEHAITLEEIVVRELRRWLGRKFDLGRDARVGELERLIPSFGSDVAIQ